MNWFNNLKIRTKMLIGFLAIALIGTINGLINTNTISTLDESDTRAYTHMTVPISDLAGISSKFQMIRSQVRDLILADTPQEVEQGVEQIKVLRGEIKSLAAKFENTILSDSVRRQFEVYADNRQKYIEYSDKFIEIVRNQGDDAAKEYLKGDFRAVAINTQNALENLVKMKEQTAYNNSLQNSESANDARMLSIIFIIVGLIISIILGVFISKGISLNIKLISEGIDSLRNICIANLKKGVEQLADGETDIKIVTGVQKLDIKLKDETGQLASNLNLIIDMIEDTINSVVAAVSKIKILVTESNSLVSSAVDGVLDKRGNSSGLKGGYKELIDGINKTIDAIVGPISEAGVVLETMAEGDLTVRMKGNYKGIYQKFNNNINMLAESLHSTLQDVSHAVQTTASAASQISSSTEEMASSAEEQSSQTTEIAASIEQITKTIFESSKNTSVAAEASATASISANRGKQKIGETKDGIQKIVTTVDTLGGTINSLTRKSDEIGEITSVIDEIAEQTNLLALNAAIEAARAGDQGRGFAVVADEVRKLAERTTKATKEIADNISEIQNEAKEADKSMEDARKVVQVGMKLTEEVSDYLHEIFAGVNKVSDLISQVAAAGEEQSASAEQISKNVESMSNVTSESTAGIQQVAKATEDLNRLTTNLQGLINKFKIAETKNSYAVRSNGHLVTV